MNLRTDLHLHEIDRDHLSLLPDGEGEAPFFRGMLVTLALAIPFWVIVAVITRAFVTR